ncbi:hypothetical protein ACFO3U_00990 [Flavobacterium ponti]|uniref:Uncharacterized protein n=1 Tax=Flavobacterium ponti TaxID=665133 RepID=A0ABV9P352_9FLAO
MYKSIFIFIISLLFISCNDETTQEDNEKIIAKNKQTFNLLSSIWDLKVPTLSPTAENEVSNWNEWQQFVIEINQKPKSNLTAFQLKTKNISSKIDSLQLNIPSQFNIPQVKSRIAALDTKIKMLDSFIHLTDVPQNKIKELIPEINEEMKSLVGQWEEIIIKKRIPKEVGEEYMIQALDTTRNASPELMMEKIRKQDSIDNQQFKDENKSPQRKKLLKTE